MSLVRRIWGARTRTLDRRGGRAVLAHMATVLARRETDDDVAVVYRGAWFARLDGTTIAPSGSKRFVYRHGDEIRNMHEWQLQDVHDTWLYRYAPRAGDVIVDAGTGVGSETFIFSRAVGEGGRVVAIEPHSETCRIL
jgi:hypothetical protein